MPVITGNASLREEVAVKNEAKTELTLISINNSNN